jgi:hypothetical protein
MDELARFLETQYHRPVCNVTTLEGRWTLLLPPAAVQDPPPVGKESPLRDLGLGLQWEDRPISVVVIKDIGAQ